MSIKSFSRLHPVIRSWNHSIIPTNYLKTKLESVALENLSGFRFYARKGKKSSETPKKEEIAVKMPGFVNPENKNEEGYFTEQTKQQIRDLKNKVIKKSSVTNPEKKE